MLGNNSMETASTKVTSIPRRNNLEKSTWKTHQYYVDFESRIHVEISTSNRCHNFLVDSPFKIDVISTNFHVEFSRRIDGESTRMCPLGKYNLQTTCKMQDGIKLRQECKFMRLCFTSERCRDKVSL